MNPATVKQKAPTLLAATVAPEDIGIGDWLAVISCTQEYPAWLYGSCSFPSQPSVQVQERDSRGVPLKVKAICLPFILTREIGGERCVIDIRCSKVVKLSKRYAKKYKALGDSTNSIERCGK